MEDKKENIKEFIIRESKEILEEIEKIVECEKNNTDCLMEIEKKTNDKEKEKFEKFKNNYLTLMDIIHKNIDELKENIKVLNEKNI